MNPLDFLGLLPAFLGMIFQSPQQQPVVTRVVVQEQLIIGVPLRPRVSRPIVWTEKKGPKCISGNAIVGALLSSDHSVDFLLSNRTRIRAQFDNNCPALDYYDRLYLQPEDQNVCAGRDSVRSRMGGVCQIERFRRLIPKVRD